MKMLQNDQNQEDQVQAGPKLRNIHDEAEVSIEKADGPDKRLVFGAAVILLFTLFVGIRGSISCKSLSSQIEAQNKLLTDAKAEALLYGITTDSDGDLVVPEVNTDSTDVSELDWDSIEQRNKQLLDAFTSTLLNWTGKTGYDNVRQKLINDWKFTEDSKLLTAFMPPVDELDANISLSSYKTFVLSDDGKNLSYFLICTVRSTVGGGSANGTVGIRITINEDGTISDVTAQTLM